MSDKMCNHCILELIKVQAAAKFQTVSIRDADFPAMKEFNNGSTGKDVYVDGVFSAWLMHIPESCEC